MEATDDLVNWSTLFDFSTISCYGGENERVWDPIVHNLQRSFASQATGDYFCSIDKFCVLLYIGGALPDGSILELGRRGIGRLYYDKAVKKLSVALYIHHQDWKGVSILNVKLFLVNYIQEIFRRMLKWCSKRNELKSNSGIGTHFDLAVRHFLENSEAEYVKPKNLVSDLTNDAIDAYLEQKSSKQTKGAIDIKKYH